MKLYILVDRLKHAIKKGEFSGIIYTIMEIYYTVFLLLFGTIIISYPIGGYMNIKYNCLILKLVIIYFASLNNVLHFKFAQNVIHVIVQLFIPPSMYIDK